MEMDELQKLMAELMAAHRRAERLVKKMKRRGTMPPIKSEQKSRNEDLETLIRQVTEANTRLARIENRHRGGSLQ